MRGGRLVPATSAGAALVVAVAVLLGLQLAVPSGLGSAGTGSSDGRGLFSGGRTPLPPLVLPDDPLSAPATRTSPLQGRDAVDGSVPVFVRDAGPTAPRARVSNDDLAQARDVTALPWSDHADALSREDGEPSSCSSSGSTAWYRFRSARPVDLVAIAVGSPLVASDLTSPSVLGAFTGESGPEQQVGCAPTDGTLYLTARPGTTYWFQVVTSGRDGATFSLRERGRTTLASVTPTGEQPDAGSYDSVYSADGRHLLFSTAAHTISDRVDPTCRSPFAVPTSPSSYHVPTSAEDRNVANLGWCRHLWLRDTRTGRLELMDARPDGRSAAGDAYKGGMSRDASRVAFYSWAADLLPGRNPLAGLVVRDRRTGVVHPLRLPDGTQPTMTLVSGPAPVLSGNGRFVAFWHTSAQLGVTESCPLLPTAPQRLCAQLFLWDVDGGGVTRVSRTPEGGQIHGSAQPVPLHVSDDGRYVTWAHNAPDVVRRDTNGAVDVFRTDLRTGTTERLSLDASGRQLADGVSADDRAVAVTPDGRHLVFSTKTRATSDDLGSLRDVFVRDTRTGRVRLVSRGLDGLPATREEADITYVPSVAITPDGRWVAFADGRSDLVRGDTNRVADIFRWDRRTGRVERVSLRDDGTQTLPGYQAFEPSLKPDGQTVAMSGYLLDGRPEDGCYCAQVWERRLG